MLISTRDTVVGRFEPLICTLMLSFAKFLGTLQYLFISKTIIKINATQQNDLIVLAVSSLQGCSCQGWQLRWEERYFS